MSRTFLLILAGWFACCVFGGASASAAPAPAQRAEMDDYLFEPIDPKLGLSRADIITALQTRDGYLWIGTGGGLARFDGARFVSFRLPTSPAFLNHLVNCLMEDREGRLWIGTDWGVLRYNQGSFERVGLAEASVKAIVQDQAGRVWCGTFGQGLYVYEGDQLKRVEDPALASPFITCLCADTTNRLWVGFARVGGVACLEQGKFCRYVGGGAMAGEIQTIAQTAEGTLWFGARREGLFRLRNGELSVFTTRDGLTNPQVYELRPASDGGLWVMTDGLQKVAPGDRFAIASVPVPLTDRPGSVCEDHEGGIWVCGRSSGLFYGRQVPYRTITTANGLPDNAIKSLTEDTAGNLWLSIQRRGLAKVTPEGKMLLLTQADGLPGNDPDAVFAASDGSVWAGFVHGLYQIRGDEKRFFREITTVGSIFESRDGTIWVGTSHSGVFRGRAGNFTKIDMRPERTLPFITSFAETPDGTIYVGTWSDGLIRLSGGKPEVLNRDNGLPSNEIRALYVDRAGRVWIGMRSRGLAAWDGTHWLNPDALSEAVENQVNAIAEDDRGQIWLGTPAGVLWGAETQLLAMARGEVATSVLRRAEVSDSHPAVVVRSGKQPIVWRRQNHELAFATRSGVFVVDPERVAANRAAPPMHIERMACDGRPVKLGDVTVIPPGVREISIDYTAVSFIETSRMLFRYELEGYDSNWVDAGTRRTAIYTNLPPRRYVFRVKACNSDGVWNETGAALVLEVQPFFWQTWWFILLSALGFGGATIALAHYVSFRRLQARVRALAQQAALEKERARIARDIHDDIGNRLTKISLLSGLALRDRNEPEKTGGHVRGISAAVRQVTDSLDEIVWAVNPRNDTLPHLIDYLGQFAVEFLGTAGLECQLAVPDHPPARTISSDVRHNLFLVVKEALHNVVRHAQATEVTLSISLESSVLVLMVADNGRGFVGPTDAPGADGLRNMRHRMADVGGQCEIESTPGHGTRVRLTLPWKD